MEDKKKAEKKVENDKKSEDGRKFHAEYNKNKKIVMSFEKGNLQYIFLLKSSNDFWKMFSTSALYYARVLARRHNKSVKIHIDKDMYYSYDGYVAIRDFDGFLEIMEAEGAKYDETHSPNEYIRAYKLKEMIPEEEIKGLRKQEKNEREKVNEILKTAEQYPDINFALNEFVNRVVIEYRKEHNNDRLKILGRLLDVAIDMKVAFRDMCNRLISKEEWRAQNDVYMSHVEAYIDTITATGTMTVESISILANLHGKTKQLISKGRF